MTLSMARRRTIVSWIAAEPWQLFFGAMTSLQIAAPGIGMRASWAPNVLVAEAFTLLPIGFAMALWGTPIGRTVAIVVALAILAVAAGGAGVLGRSPAESLVFFALMAPPPILLVLSARRMPA